MNSCSSSSMASISKRLCLYLLRNPPTRFSSSSSIFPLRFCSTVSSPDTTDEFDAEHQPNIESDAADHSSATPPEEEPTDQRPMYDRPLENGLDIGVYKAILVGQAGQTPVQKRLKGGRVVTLLSVGTGGIRNNRRPFDNEEPREYANRCAVQWHRVSIYPERLGDIAMKHVVPGSILYLEGNLETKIFADPITGLVRRIREIAIRRNGRIVFLGANGGAEATKHADLKGVGYY